LSLAVAACGGNGSDPAAVPETVQHTPEISNLKISPDSAAYMEGNGSVVVTAEIAFSDSGRDVAATWVQMPDGTSVKFDRSIVAETGSFTEDLAFPTNKIGAFTMEIWLVDGAGDSSVRRTVKFNVINAAEDTWTRRLSGLPYSLSDVVWNGSVFVAVGDRGAVLTSRDGISWVTRDSGTDADLNAVAADGPYVVAVGSENAPGDRGIILQSTDHGASWDIKGRPEETVLDAVAINLPQVVVGGYRFSWGTPITMISEDRAETWHAVDSWPDDNLGMTDLVYWDGTFVASLNTGMQGARVAVSSDGKLWSEIAVSDEMAVPHTIFRDENQYMLAGAWGDVFASPDGFNWTRLETPVRDVVYWGSAWNGSTLMLAGESMCGAMWICDSEFDIPIGLSSTDGGMTWEVFNIDGDYGSEGLAWGNDRFVSVGQKPRIHGEGAIYTSN